MNNMGLGAEQAPLAEEMGAVRQTLVALNERFTHPEAHDPENLFGGLGLAFQLLLAVGGIKDKGIAERMKAFYDKYSDVHTANIADHGIDTSEVRIKAITAEDQVAAQALVADIIKELGG